MPVDFTELTTALKNDKGFYQGWVANIAMSFYDTYENYREKKKDNYISRKDLRIIANDAAKAFLKRIMD